MNVTTIPEGTKLTVIAEGKLGTTAAPELENAVKNNIDGVTELIFDFEKLEFMASAGLRVLLSAAKTMKKQGSMKIIKVNPEVMEVFTFTGMADMIDIEAI
ncbi:MAG: STAS domain-containing protein [Lachnospiraceae bacterium]|nr:STAS domain-containing protein [Lachnospiraceae bacterium]